MGENTFLSELLIDKDPNSVPLSSLVHFTTMFDSKWRTSVLHRKQLILLLFYDWLISIQDGGCMCSRNSSPSTKTVEVLQRLAYLCSNIGFMPLRP